MLVDELTIAVEGGKGGRGAVTFGEDRYSKAPSGGEGGNGGSVIIEAESQVLDLGRYRFEKTFTAPAGAPGRRNKDGANGVDIVLLVPRGTLIHNHESGITNELLADGERVVVAKGGLRGRGNRAFSHARASEPKRFEPGKPGGKATIDLELQLIADAGFVGLPNVGKSSLLNALTEAKSKVANYNFTTLEPHLGVLEDGTILADIPGLIEGASTGKGLGTKFLRHIRRTRTLVHCVSADSPDPLTDYRAISGELERYGAGLSEKAEQILFTKADAVNEKDLKKKIALLKKHSSASEAGKKALTPLAVSILDDASLKKLKKVLSASAHG